MESIAKIKSLQSLSVLANLNKKHLDIEGKEMTISSGMNITVEVKVGRRRIIEFFLPAVDYVKESFELR